MSSRLPFSIALLCCVISTSVHAQVKLAGASRPARDSLRVPAAAASVAPALPSAYVVGPQTSEELQMNPDAAALVGGVVGAAVGYGLINLVCLNRYCEMRDLMGILVGFVVGSSIGYVIAGGRRPRHNAAAMSPLRSAGAEVSRYRGIPRQAAAAGRVDEETGRPGLRGRLDFYARLYSYCVAPNKGLQGTPGCP
jgi:hypothetical protein